MDKPKKFHLIAMGSQCMSDLAIALKQAGHSVTGSDESFPPGPADRLRKYQLLPIPPGWFPEKMQHGIDGVILSPGAKADNPELKRAQDLQLPIYSFAEYVHKFSEDKQRLVIAGSHGKTMIAALILHVLDFHERKFDYVVSTHIPGFESIVKLSNAPLIVIESQDVRSSVLDSTPSFLQYHHHIGVIPGIEWQQSESYPTKEEYTRQFNLFGASTPKGGVLIYFELDSVVAALSKMEKPDVQYIPYKTHSSDLQEGQELLLTPDKQRIPVKISGKHNFQNISAAQEALKKIGITSELFYQAVSTFEGVKN